MSGPHCRNSSVPLTLKSRHVALLIAVLVTALVGTQVPGRAWAETNLTVTSLEPAEGSTAGGEHVMIIGSGFSRGMALEVHFGDTRCPSMVVEDENHILVTTPESESPGPVSLQLHLGGDTVTVLNAFTYIQAEETAESDGDAGVGEESVASDAGVEAGAGSTEGADETWGDSADADLSPETQTTPPEEESELASDAAETEEYLPEANPNPDKEPPERRFADQIAADTNQIPQGLGGIFVPALTEATLEPAVDVYRDGNLIESAQTAQKIFVPAGRYLVRAGRGNDRVRPRVVVEVTEGELSVVDPPWGALVIDVVNERNIPQREAYDLIRQDTRETVGQGRGADRRSGEGLRTWILIPGVYRIVRPGGTYRERVDFATVQLNPGQALNFALVIDSDGEFRGAGIVPDTEVRTPGGVELRGALGGSVEFTHRYSDASEEDDEITFGGDIFVDFDLLVDQGWNYFWLQLQLEAGIQLNNEKQWNKTLDYIDLAAIYIFQAHRRIGPYVRGSYQSHMLPSLRYYDDPVTITYWAIEQDENNENIVEYSQNGVEELTYNRPFSENILQQGIGANWRAVRSYYLDLDLRVGIGFRQEVYNDHLTYFESEEDEVTEVTTHFFRFNEDFVHTEGIDFGIVAAGSLTGWLSYDLELVLLEPFYEPYLPIIDVDLAITIRLFSFASLNYILRVRYNPDDSETTEDTRITQAVLLRFAFNLF